MIVNQTVNPESGTYPAKPVELPLSAEKNLFPLHQFDAFLNFIFQLMLVFIISASVFPALRWLDSQFQQWTGTIQNR